MAAPGKEGASQTPGYLILPSQNNVVDLGRVLGPNARAAKPVEDIGGVTITGGRPDASDPLPEGTIIVVLEA